MTPRRVTPLALLAATAAFAVTAVAVPHARGADHPGDHNRPKTTGVPTTAPEATQPATTEAPGTRDAVDAANAAGDLTAAVRVETDPARRRWLLSIAAADPGTFAGGAELRELVDGPRVLMIGDSLMASTSRRYGGEMCETVVPLGWDVEVDAETNRFVDFGDRVLDSRLDAGFDAAVVMLGNNYGADQEVFEQHLRDIVERLAPRPTVLMTVTEFRADRREVNDTIYEIAGELDNVRVIEWSRETAANRELLAGDGLHLSELGRARFADLVAEALGRAPGWGAGECLSTAFTDDTSATTGTIG